MAAAAAGRVLVGLPWAGSEAQRGGSESVQSTGQGRTGAARHDGAARGGATTGRPMAEQQPIWVMKEVCPKGGWQTPQVEAPARLGTARLLRTRLLTKRRALSI